MRFISPRLICRFSFLLTMTVRLRGGRPARSGANAESSPCRRQHEFGSRRKCPRGGNGARSQNEESGPEI